MTAARGRLPRAPLLALLLALVAGCGSTLAPAPGEARAGVDAAIGHLRELMRIADQHGGNRATLTPGYDASVEYSARVLRDLGYDVSTPTFQFAGVVGDDGRTVRGPQRNVIAQTRTGNPDRVVMLGAHLDSAPEGPGINDNGSGVAMLLELARQLAAGGPTTNAVRFALWGSEEQSMVGSTRYVEALSARDRAKIMLYLNADMVASPNPGYFVQGGVGSGPEETGPPGSAEIARVLADQFEKLGVDVETITFRADSDFHPFVKAGIPSGGLLTGADDEKTRRQASAWGGDHGEAFDGCYHRECDDLDNVDRVALERFLRAAGGAVEHFAMRSEGLPA